VDARRPTTGGAHVPFASRSRALAVLAIPVICMLCSAGCAPTFGRLAVPTGNPATPDSWRPARSGDRIRLTMVAGDRYEGTIAALGDSIDIIVITGPGRSLQSFSRQEIARVEVRPQQARGERTVQVLFWMPIVAGLLVAYSLRGLN